MMDGQTDMTKLIIAFRNFTEEPKNYPVKFLYPIIPGRTLSTFKQLRLALVKCHRS